jgi:hypothetical protein
VSKVILDTTTIAKLNNTSIEERISIIEKASMVKKKKSEELPEITPVQKKIFTNAWNF